MNRIMLFIVPVLAALGAAPASTPSHQLLFEPGTRPHEYVSRGPNGSLRLTSAGVDFAANDQPWLRMALAGAKAVEPEAAGLLPSVSHYYLGNDPSKWRIGVANYSKVGYRGVYPGIDMVFHGAGEGAFEYDFLVAAHADPSLIRMRFDGAKDLSLNAAGDLIVGGLTQHRPRVLQGAKTVDGHFRIHRDRTVSFELGRYDRSQPLTIDPVITYVSYLGGSSGENGNNVSVDAAGNVYVTGWTTSNDFPGSIVFGQRPSVHQVAFMTKFGPFAGGKTQLLFTVILGDNISSGFSIATAVTADLSGNIIVTGETTATGFPLQNAIQSKIAGGLDCSVSDGGQPILCTDAFVTKLSPDGRTLIFSTYYGGKLSNQFNDVTTDASGSIYLAGYGTGITDLQGTPDAIQLTATGSQDMMIARFDPNGKVLYSTYLGGSGNDGAVSLTLERTGVVWVGGGTKSSDMPMAASNGFQTTFSGFSVSAFIARIDMTKSGSAGLTYTSYFNGDTNSNLVKLFLDPAGQVVFCGSTISDNLPTTPTALEARFVGLPVSAINRPDFTSGDGYMARINPAIAGAGGLTYMSYVGGSGSDSATGCGLDSKGNFVMSGYTDSSDLFFQPSLGSSIPYKALAGNGGTSIFMIRFDPTMANGYLDSFLMGGTTTDVTTAMAIDSKFFAYLTGVTFSHQFPASAMALQRKYGGDDASLLNGFGQGDSFVIQADLNGTEVAPTQLIASGDFQFGPAGSTLAAPIAVQLADASGNPVSVSGYPINLTGTNFTVTPNSFMVTPSGSTSSFLVTDGSGVGSATIQLSGDAAITASVGITGSTIKPYIFHLKALTGTLPASVAIVSGDKQSGAAGAVLAQPLVVELRDATNAPLPLAGLTVQFKATNASVPAVNVVTDSTGRASTTVTLGTAAGNASVQVVVGSLPVATATFSISGGGALSIAAGGVLSAATFLGGGVSPGLIVTLFGSGLGPAVLAVNAAGADGKFSTTLAGTQVLFDGVAAPLIYASSGQTSAIVPYAVAGKASTQVKVVYQNVSSAAQTVTVVPAQLGLFSSNSSGSGQGAILNQDNSVNSASNPAKRNSIVILFGTGEGVTTPPGVDGQTALGPVYPKPNTSVTVKIGGSDGQVLYYGAAPTLVAGVLQVNVKIPAGIPDGNATVQIFEGSSGSPSTITVAVQGVE